jgi:Uncharacterized protein conserved in bacteria
MRAGLERVFNRYLWCDPQAPRRLSTLDGKLLALELRGLNLTVYVLLRREGLRFPARAERVPDTYLRALPLALLRLAAGNNVHELVSSGLVEISGDAEVAQRFRELLASIEVDWEEELARVVGDVLAHRIGNGVRNVRNYASHTCASLTRDLGEYLQYETRKLPSAHEVMVFLDAIDQLRNDSDRLEARISRLYQHFKGGVIS